MTTPKGSTGQQMFIERNDLWTKDQAEVSKSILKKAKALDLESIRAVSYTHLTLPTILLV